MKKFLFAFFLVFVSSLALALPTPKEIESAVRGGQLSQAESMLREVLREKPNSARAHYEIGQVLVLQGRKIEGREELESAQRLDPSLKFAGSPQRFHEVMKRTAAPAVPDKTQVMAPVARTSSPEAPTLPPAVTQPRTSAPASSGFPWTWLLIGGGVVLAGVWLVRRLASAPAPLGTPASGSAAGRNCGEQFGSAGTAAAPVAPANHGVRNAVLGGVAGLAAGYGLSQVLGHGNEAKAADNTGDRGYQPIESGNSADTSSFDAGSGDDWDSGDSTSDDNW